MQWSALVILAGAVGAIQNATNPKLGTSLDNRALAYDDLLHYRWVMARAETLRLMEAIDATIAERGGRPLA
jgi:hypothetical protein